MIKRLIEFLGFWINRTNYLPIGTDLRIDLHYRYHLGEVNTIFDVGANIGQSFIRFRRAFPKSKIICFEPVESSFNILSKRIEADKNSKAELMALGSYAHTTEIKLFEEWSVLNSLVNTQMNQDPKARIQQVIVKPLDDYCEKHKISHIDLLKIDTEGYETEVLKGAKRMLEKGAVRCILCEVGFYEANTRNTSFFRLLAHMDEFGYLFSGLYDFNNEMSVDKKMFANILFIKKEILRD